MDGMFILTNKAETTARWSPGDDLPGLMMAGQKGRIKMTNAEIIYAARVQLANTGKLNTVNGVPEEIHTYQAWKKLGYQVLRGEKAVCILKIWKPIPKKGKPEPEEEEKRKDDPWMMLKTAYFFSQSQVDSIV